MLCYFYIAISFVLVFSTIYLAYSLLPLLLSRLEFLILEYVNIIFCHTNTQLFWHQVLRLSGIGIGI